MLVNDLCASHFIFCSRFSTLNSLIKLTDHRSEKTQKVTNLPKFAGGCTFGWGHQIANIHAGLALFLGNGFTLAEADVLPLNYSRPLESPTYRGKVHLLSNLQSKSAIRCIRQVFGSFESRRFDWWTVSMDSTNSTGTNTKKYIKVEAVRSKRSRWSWTVRPSFLRIAGKLRDWPRRHRCGLGLRIRHHRPSGEERSLIICVLPLNHGPFGE
jgi:hypothetical protein